MEYFVLRNGVLITRLDGTPWGFPSRYDAERFARNFCDAKTADYVVRGISA